MPAGAAIGIICKTPRAGASKTRLEPLCGRAGAAALAAAFLRDIAATIDAVPRNLSRTGYAVYAPAGSEAELKPLLPDDFGLLCRRDSSLGGVLSQAIEYFLGDGHDCALLVNGDSPTLPLALLTGAIDALRRPGDRVVLVPATDGGYCLIGLKRRHAELFEDIPWSTPGVFAATCARAAEIGLGVEQLPPWYDIDDGATFAMLRAELDGAPLDFNSARLVGARASATRALLVRLGLTGVPVADRAGVGSPS